MGRIRPVSSATSMNSAASTKPRSRCLHRGAVFLAFGLAPLLGRVHRQVRPPQDLFRAVLRRVAEGYPDAGEDDHHLSLDLERLTQALLATPCVPPSFVRAGWCPEQHGELVAEYLPHGVPGSHALAQPVGY